MQFQEAYKKLISLSNLQTTSYSSSPQELEASLRRTKKLLRLVGTPEQHLRFVHITGTSGKGSTAYMMHEILRQSGISVGTYLSPHTTSYLERFLVNDRLIDPKIIVKGIEVMTSAYATLLKDESPMSFFELSTVLSIYAMERAGAKYMVLEVGCGGRYDATNVIPAPEIGIITNINKDHTKLLGDTLAQIAYEKAGIMKNRSTILCGELRPALKKIFTKEAIKKSSALFFIPPPTEDKVPAHLGKHQQHNAALAERAAQELGIDQETIDKALQSIRPLPCRFETISTKPRIILDGAHSRAKMEATANQLREIKGDVHILLGHVVDKPGDDFIKLLAPMAKMIHTTRFTTAVRKAANPVALLKQVPKRKRGESFIDPVVALNAIKKTLKKGDVLLITGSLYLAGELRSRWISEEKILQSQSSFGFDKKGA